MEMFIPSYALEKPRFKYMLAPFRLLFKAYFGLYFFVTLTILYPLFYWSLAKSSRFPIAFKLKRIWAFILQLGYFSGFSRKVEAPLPEGPFIVCCNHTSYLDIIMMYRAIPRYFIFMGKQELLKWPLFNIFFKKMDLAVNRSSSSAAARSFMKAKAVLQEGHVLAIFPEGTIPRHSPRLSRFKDGAFKLAIECQVPIVPMTFLTNWRLLSDTESPLGHAGPGIARVVIHPPVSTKGMTSKDLVDLRQQVFNTIDSTLKERWK
jgi:1-acyl-sn-glycerol-3-phosphate acyltransferase